MPFFLEFMLLLKRALLIACIHGLLYNADRAEVQSTENLSHDTQGKTGSKVR